MSVVSAVPDRARVIADDLVPGRWPTADVPALRDGARRCRDLAAQVRAALADLEGAHRRHGTGRGACADGVEAARAALIGSPDSVLGRAAHRLEITAASLDAYADATEAAREEMTVVAMITDRERARGDLLATLGDDSLRVSAASAGRLALDAAADEHTEHAGDIGRRHRDEAAAPVAPAASAPVGGAGLMPFAALGGAGWVARSGLRGSVLGDSGGGDSGSVDDSLGAADAEWLRGRAAQLQAAVPASVAGSVRLAVGVGRRADGSSVVVVGTDDPYPYLRGGTVVAAQETLVGDGRGAEVAILDHMTRSGARMRAVAAATPMPVDVIDELSEAGIDVFAPDVEQHSGPDHTDHPTGE